MTPEQLRVRAFKFIETARSIVAGDPDYASHTVGYALEFVLKARFCSKVGLAAFPDDRKEAKRLQVAHALTHDFDALLKLTDDEGISRARTPNVEWSVAFEWGVEGRYTPVGHRSIEQASAQIVATEEVCEELCRYEAMDRLQKVEVEASAERGPF